MVTAEVETEEVVDTGVTYETDTTPVNLPTGTIPAFVQSALTHEHEEGVSSDTNADTDMKELEDYAHAHSVLLSSDAMRHFEKITENMADSFAFLDSLIEDAKITYPAEDGWIVLNLERMQTLCAKSVGATEDTELPVFTPESVILADATSESSVGIGSLAEAIVSGNVQAAYQMIESRPMVALADASADLDAIHRMRKGNYVEDATASEMLKSLVKNVSTEQLEATIVALTSSIDGTYTDEKAAVKISVMKAIAIVTK